MRSIAPGIGNSFLTKIEPLDGALNVCGTVLADGAGAVSLLALELVLGVTGGSTNPAILVVGGDINALVYTTLKTA